MNKPLDFVEWNRANWDERAEIHYRDATGFYGISRLLAGQSLLTPIEKGQLPPLAGKSVAHFQCHIGTDTLSFLHEGAARVAGIDFSPVAIAKARDLAERAGLPAHFAEGAIAEAPEKLGNDFDLVFTSWGTTVWIDDLKPWAEAIAACLKPGGQFLYADCHPMVFALDRDRTGLYVRYDYVTDPARPIAELVERTYTFAPEPLANRKTFEWRHGIADLVGALMAAGLRIERLGEHDGLPWLHFEQTVRGEDRLWRLPPDSPQIPLSLTILASKPLD